MVATLATAMLATGLLAAKLLQGARFPQEVALPSQAICISQRPQAVQRVAAAASAAFPQQLYWRLGHSLAPGQPEPFRPLALADALGTAASYQISPLARSHASAQAGAQLQAWPSSPTLTHLLREIQIQQVLPWPHALTLQPLAILSMGTMVLPKSP